MTCLMKAFQSMLIAYVSVSSIYGVSGFPTSCQILRHTLTRPKSCPSTSANVVTPIISLPKRIVLQASQMADSAAAKDDDENRNRGVLMPGGCNFGKWSFGLISLVLFIMPDKTFTKHLASKWGGAGGFGIASYLFYLLQTSSTSNSVEYDNFLKRCQLGLAGFCALGLCSIPGEAAFFSTPVLAMIMSALITGTRLGGLMVSLRIWASNVSEVRFNKELWYGCLNTLRGFKVQDKKKSLFYRNSAVIVGLAMISNMLEGLFQMRYHEALEISSFATSLSLSAVSRLFLISNLLHSLKLASESDDFPQKVYWELNWALAAWAGVVGIGQCLSYPLRFSFRRVEMLSFSALLFLKGYKAYRREYPLDAESDENGNKPKKPSGY